MRHLRFPMLFLFLLPFLQPQADDDFDRLREQFVTLTVSGCSAADDNAARQILERQRADGTFTDVDYTDGDGGRWDLRRHWHALNALARSWRFSKTGLANDPRLRDAVIRGIENWAERKYTNRNWWYQSIGIPLQSTQTLLTMGDALPPETLRRFRPILDRSKIGMTAQNRLHLATIHFLKGVIYRDAKMVEEGRAVILEEIAFAQPGHEGLQADFSFHQHYAQMQFGNYGLAFLATGALWSGVMKNTRFAWPVEKRRLLADYFENGMRWVIFRDIFDFNACGRQIVGPAQTEKALGARNAICGDFDAPDAETAGRIADFFADTGNLAGNRFFFRSDFMVHRRRNFYFSVKMCSRRVIGSESTNYENELGRHTAAGVFQLLRRGDEYLKIMPLWNWRRLPGLTALQDNSPLRSPDRYYYNRASLVGGVSDGRNGAAMLQLETDGLSARKSVFTFDDTIVMIGDAITATSEFPVETTIDSRWYRTAVEIQTADGGRTTLTDCGEHRLENVTTIRHDDLEYRFPVPASPVIEIAERSADWTAIQPSFKNQPPVKGKVLTIRLEHGVRPQNAGYCFLITPAGDNSAPLPARITSAPGIHAVFDEHRKTGFALFYTPGRVEFPGYGILESAHPAAVLIRDGTLTAADPAQQEERFRFRLGNRELEGAFPQGVHAGESIQIPLAGS